MRHTVASLMRCGAAKSYPSSGRPQCIKSIAPDDSELRSDGESRVTSKLAHPLDSGFAHRESCGGIRVGVGQRG